MKTGLLIVFGATGNLMYKKLMPALANLLAGGHLPKETKIFCIGRRAWTTDDYLLDAKNNVTNAIDWSLLESRITYLQLQFDVLQDYTRLKQNINALKNDVETMVYLAVPPKLFPMIAKGLHHSNIVARADSNARIVFEKPFGENLESARTINRVLWEYFDESQLYRIDHYLGKDMIQNILIVRFANPLFEASWHRGAIESITILAKESESILKRGNYYDGIGAMKDMLQSHLLQMASLILMERPASYDSEAIKDEKVNVMKRLKLDQNALLLGQYRTYKEAENVPKDSQTETFVFARATVDHPRWQGVPIYFVTGKMLDEKRSEIIIDFKSDSPQFFNTEHNKLMIKVAPEEGVNIRFNVKKPGLHESITPAVLDYCHSCQAVGNTPEAYEKLLLDLFQRQNSLFARWDEIETAWEIIEPIKQIRLTPLQYDTYADLKSAIESTLKERLDDL